MSFLVTPGGVRLRISDRGGDGGATIVLVHGWKQSHRLWDGTTAALAGRHRVVAYDLRGMGESDKPRGSYDFDQHADDLAAVIAELELDDVTLVGWSMGCSVSLQYLGRHRCDVVRRLVLINGPVRLTTAEDFPHTMPAAVVERLLEDMAAHWPTRERAFVAASIRDPHPDQVEWLLRIALQTPLDIALRAVREQLKLDHRETLRALPIPVLAAYGRADPYYPVALADWIAANAPRGERVIFEHSAHCIPFEEGPRFRAELESFIARHPA